MNWSTYQDRLNQINSMITWLEDLDYTWNDEREAINRMIDKLRTEREALKDQFIDILRSQAENAGPAGMFR